LIGYSELDGPKNSITNLNPTLHFDPVFRTFCNTIEEDKIMTQIKKKPYKKKPIIYA
jgi:hypothetical protein